MSTFIRYNGVPLYDVHTQSINNTFQPDSTGVDPIFNRVTVSARCLVKRTADGPSLGTGVPVVGDFAVGLNNTLGLLSMPRRDFFMSINGTTLFNVQAPKTEYRLRSLPLHAIDLNHGPKPKVTVIRITGSDSAYIEFTVELALAVCDDKLPRFSSGEVINLRWWYAEDINGENFLATRRFEGVLRLSSHNDLNPLIYSGLVLPPLANGFRRKSITFHEASDGLELQFVVVDEETYRAAPKPATDWSGYHAVAFPRGMLATEQMQLQLKGPKGVSQVTLANLAWKIIDIKTQFNDHILHGDGSVYLLNATQKFDMKNCIVDSNVHMQHIGKGTKSRGEGIFGLLGDTLGRELTTLEDYHPNVSFNPGPSASFIGLLSMPLPQNPCNVESIFQRSFGSSSSKVKKSKNGGSDERIGDSLPQQSEPDLTIQRSGDQLLSGQKLSFSDEHYQFAYSEYKIHSQIEINSGKVALPRGIPSKKGIGGNAKEFVVTGGDTLFVGSLHAPVALRRVKISAQRLNKHPVMPENVSFTDKNGIKHTPLHYIPGNAAGRVSFDGRKVLYDSEIEIIYALSRPPGPSDPIPVGDVPYHQKDAKPYETCVPPQSFIPPSDLLE